MRDLTIETAVVEWLRYERQCVIVCLERGINEFYRPDVFAVDKLRRCIEVECKRTVADFKADAAKSVSFKRQHETLNVRQFYYAVPPQIVDVVRPLLPTYAGLLTIGDLRGGYTKLPKIECEAGAPVNRQARKLSLREMARMCKHQTATLHRLMSYIVKEEHDSRRP